MMTNKKPDERLDDLQVKGYEIIQKPGRFCFGMDAVLLSSYAKVKRGERALDLGTGTGILPILLEAKNPGLHYTGLEVQEESADMARRSVAHNGLENKIDIVTGDIKEASHIFGNDSYEVIVSNPPYMIGEHGLKNDNEALYIARHEALCTLDDLLRESAKVLKMKGRFYMVHRPFRLPEIFNVQLRNRAETYASRPPICRQRAKHGSYRRPQRRKTTPRRRPAAHSLHERRGVYGRSTEIVRDEIKGELYVRNIISVCNSDRQPGGHDISLCPYFERS